jgi:hypothetical protein
MMVLEAQTDLLQIVGALRSPGGLPRSLYGGEQQGDQDSDDGDHNQQLDKSKTARAARPPSPTVSGWQGLCKVNLTHDRCPNWKE